MKKTVNQSEIADIDAYTSKIFPKGAQGYKLEDLQLGEGKPAICGQQVTLAYQSYLAQGNALSDAATPEKPLRFTIGDGHVMPVFDTGVIGMKVGGTRSIMAPPQMSYGLKQYQRDDIPTGATIRFEMSLLSASPDYPDASNAPYRIAELSQGQGGVIMCGDRVSYKIRIWDVHGKTWYENNEETPLIFTAGKSEVMLGIEQAVVGMHVGGNRLLVVPPAFQNTLSGKAPKLALPVPDDEVVLVELLALSLDNQMTR